MLDLTDDAAAMLLGVLCRHTVELLGAAPTPLRHIRVHIGDIGVELGWAADRPPGGALGGAPVREGRRDKDPACADPAGADQPGVRPQQEDAGSADQEPDIVCAPTVGAFYRRAEPDADPFVELNDIIEAGQQLGILEAMKLMNPILAEFPGRVVAILAEDGESVEYGQPLFAVASC